KVDTRGIITTVAGNGFGFSGDGGPATAATIWAPAEVSVDCNGNLFFADRNNNRIRKIDSRGMITTVAGNGQGGFFGDGGPAISALLGYDLLFRSAPTVDSQGNLFIADSDNERIRKVDTKGTISTVALFPITPFGVVVDSGGNLFVPTSNF